MTMDTRSPDDYLMDWARDKLHELIQKKYIKLTWGPEYHAQLKGLLYMYDDTCPPWFNQTERKWYRKYHRQVTACPFRRDVRATQPKFWNLSCYVGKAYDYAAKRYDEAKGA